MPRPQSLSPELESRCITAVCKAYRLDDESQLLNPHADETFKYPKMICFYILSQMGCTSYRIAQIFGIAVNSKRSVAQQIWRVGRWRANPVTNEVIKALLDEVGAENQ